MKKNNIQYNSKIIFIKKKEIFQTSVLESFGESVQSFGILNLNFDTKFSLI